MQSCQLLCNHVNHHSTPLIFIVTIFQRQRRRVLSRNLETIQYRTQEPNEYPTEKSISKALRESQFSFFLSFFVFERNKIASTCDITETWNRNFQQPSLLTACSHICSPLPNLCLRHFVILCWASKTDLHYHPPNPNYISDPKTSPHRLPHFFTEWIGPSSGGKSLDFSGWVEATLLSRGLATWGGLLRED